jgi:hypothetical protein
MPSCIFPSAMVSSYGPSFTPVQGAKKNTRLGIDQG